MHRRPRVRAAVHTLTLHAGPHFSVPSGLLPSDRPHTRQRRMPSSFKGLQRVQARRKRSHALLKRLAPVPAPEGRAAGRHAESHAWGPAGSAPVVLQAAVRGTDRRAAEQRRALDGAAAGPRAARRDGLLALAVQRRRRQRSGGEGHARRHQRRRRAAAARHNMVSFNLSLAHSSRRAHEWPTVPGQPPWLAKPTDVKPRSLARSTNYSVLCKERRKCARSAALRPAAHRPGVERAATPAAMTGYGNSHVRLPYCMHKQPSDSAIRRRLPHGCCLCSISNLMGTVGTLRALGCRAALLEYAW